jgi:hypothetical protein
MQTSQLLHNRMKKGGGDNRNPFKFLARHAGRNWALLGRNSSLTLIPYQILIMGPQKGRILRQGGATPACQEFL